MIKRFRVEDWLHRHYNRTLKECLDEIVKLGVPEKAAVVTRVLRMLGVTPEDIIEAKLEFIYP